MNLNQLRSLLVSVGCQRVFVKTLAKNDNTKQQVYFGTNFQALNLFPIGGIKASDDPSKVILKANLPFGWLLQNGNVAQSSGAQIILYPQYPEVRFSGFLEGCDAAPSDLMTMREAGRVLFLGVTLKRRVVGFVVGPQSEIALEFQALGLKKTIGVFVELPLPAIPTADEARSKLLSELGRIHHLGWIDSKQLGSDGRLQPCNAPQCGGFTLEAELRIPKNSDAEPDFLGWEVKQYDVDDFDRIESSKPITLMTPEPTGGFYREHDVEAFVRKFGYADKSGKPDRLNFGGRHFVGVPCAATRLTLEIRGYDVSKGEIEDANGSIALLNTAGEVAAEWSFAKILEHWSHKHTKAVYVPSNCRKEPLRQYRYGHKVRLAQVTDGLRLLKAFVAGSVYYDPAIKVERASSERPTAKKRSQFRVSSKSISALYKTVEVVEL